jgi:hypothetical protein
VLTADSAVCYSLAWLYDHENAIVCVNSVLYTVEVDQSQLGILNERYPSNHVVLLF